MLKNRKRSDILVKLVGLCRYRDIKIVYIILAEREKFLIFQ